jgi:hypothetical protein
MHSLFEDYYSQGFPNDRRTLKALVYSVYLLQLAQTLLRTVTSWKMLASGFGNIDDIDTVSTTAWLSLCVTGGGGMLILSESFFKNFHIVKNFCALP